MKSSTLSQITDSSHPLDSIEETALSKEWTYERPDPDEIFAEIAGRWCIYKLYAAFREDINTLHMACSYDLRIPSDKRQTVYELLALINERLWLGHFDLSSEDDTLLFRYTLPMMTSTKNIDDQVSELVETSLLECDRFYPALQFVLWGGKSAKDATTAAMLDTVGEA